MIYIWIFIIVFPIVFLLQVASAKNKNKQKNGTKALNSQDIIKVLISSVGLTLVAYIAYFFGLMRD